MGLRIILASVDMQHNYKFLPNLARRSATIGVDCFRVLRLMPTSDEMLNQLIPYEKMQELAKDIVSIQEEEGIVVDIHAHPGFFESGYYTPSNYPYLMHPLCTICTAGKMTMAILPNGQCMPCVAFKDDDFICGNILEDPIPEIWQSKPMTLLRNAAPDNYTGFCGTCKYKWSCYSARCIAHKYDITF